MNVLIIYATSEGQTRKIASFAADRLTSRGHRVTLAEASHVPAGLDASRFDAALIAAPVHVGRYPPGVIRFVRDQAAALDAVPSAFLSVSLSAASDAPGDVQGLKRCLDAFLQQTRWAPRRVHHVAGALRYTAYGFLTRWVMRTIALRRNAPTDTRRDHELTDWNDLTDFVDEFAAEASRSAPGHA